jgi:hypothetical protein
VTLGMPNDPVEEMAELVGALAEKHKPEHHSAGDGYTCPRESWVKCSCGVNIWDWQQYYNENEDDPDAQFALHFGYLVARQVAAQTLRDAAEALSLPGSSANGYYAAEADAGYRDAERDAETWLKARADDTEGKTE